MIPAQLLHRLVAALTASITDDGDDIELSIAGHRERLADFAGLHDLDLEDFSTLLRVASGEAPEIVSFEDNR